MKYRYTNGVIAARIDACNASLAAVLAVPGGLRAGTMSRQQPAPRHALQSTRMLCMFFTLSPRLHYA